MNLHRKLSVSVLLLALSGSALAEVSPPMGDVMAGEFALQQGDLPAAARYYLLASQVSRDTGLAERATRIALLADERRLAERALERWRTLAPDSMAMRSATLHLALRQGEHESAMDQARSLLAVPGEDGFAVLLASLAEATGDEGVIARSVMRRVFRESLLPDSLAQWLRFAGLALRLGDRDFSNRVIEAGLARFPNDPRAALLEVSRLREAGQADAAREKLLALRASGELSPDLRRTAAGELARLGEPRMAASLLGEGVQDEATYGQRAAWLVAANDLPALEALYAEINRAGEASPGRRFLLGHIAEGLSHWQDAQRWYAGVVRGPFHDQALLRNARVLDRLGRLDAALDLLHELQADDSADGERVRDSYLLESELLQRQGRGDDASTRLDQGLAVFEDDPILLYARALQHQRADRVQPALDDLGRLLADDPENVQALNAYGYLLADRRGKFAEALPYLQRAHALRPDYAPVLDSLGWVQLNLGQPEVGLDLLRQAWSRLKDAEIAAHLGEALWRLERRDEARAIWDEGRRLQPENRALRRVQETYKP